MAAITRPRSLQTGRHSISIADIQICRRIQRPPLLVKIACKKPASIVQEQRIGADDLLAGQMILDGPIRQRQTFF